MDFLNFRQFFIIFFESLNRKFYNFFNLKFINSLIIKVPLNLDLNVPVVDILFSRFVLLEHFNFFNTSSKIDFKKREFLEITTFNLNEIYFYLVFVFWLIVYQRELCNFFFSNNAYTFIFAIKNLEMIEWLIPDFVYFQDIQLIFEFKFGEVDIISHFLNFFFNSVLNEIESN